MANKSRRARKKKARRKVQNILSRIKKNETEIEKVDLFENTSSGFLCQIFGDNQSATSTEKCVNSEKCVSKYAKKNSVERKCFSETTLMENTSKWLGTNTSLSKLFSWLVPSGEISHRECYSDQLKNDNFKPTSTCTANDDDDDVLICQRETKSQSSSTSENVTCENLGERVEIFAPNSLEHCKISKSISHFQISPKILFDASTNKEICHSYSGVIPKEHVEASEQEIYISTKRSLSIEENEENQPESNATKNEVTSPKQMILLKRDLSTLWHILQNNESAKRWAGIISERWQFIIKFCCWVFWKINDAIRKSLPNLTYFRIYNCCNYDFETKHDLLEGRICSLEKEFEYLKSLLENSMKETRALPASKDLSPPLPPYISSPPVPPTPPPLPLPPPPPPLPLPPNLHLTPVTKALRNTSGESVNEVAARPSITVEDIQKVQLRKTPKPSICKTHSQNKAPIVSLELLKSVKLRSRSAQKSFPVTSTSSSDNLSRDLSPCNKSSETQQNLKNFHYFKALRKTTPHIKDRYYK